MSNRGKPRATPKAEIPKAATPNPKPPEKTLGAVRDLLIQRDGPPVDAMAVLGGQALSAAAMLSQGSEETVGNIMATTLGHTKFLDSHGMREMLSRSDFSALDLNNGNTTVYFVLPPEYLSVHARALRLMLNTFLAAATKGRKGKHETVFILDEFFSLGAQSSMTNYVAILRNYGVRIWIIVQNITQLVALYKENSETFFANAAQVQIFGVNDKAGADYFSARLGNRVAWRKRQVQTNQGMRTEWEPVGTHRLRDGIEIGRSTSRESGLQIVLNEGGDPFLLRRNSLRQNVQGEGIHARPVRAAETVSVPADPPENSGVHRMNNQNKAGWRPRRFDVAGAHPDEAWRAVANVAEATEEIRKQFIGGPEIGAVNTMLWQWRQNKPLRFGKAGDADVQRFLAQGVEIMDALKAKMPLGLSDSQRQVRNRCHELAKSMEKVLARRPDEQPQQRFNRKPRMRM